MFDRHSYEVGGELWVGKRVGEWMNKACSKEGRNTNQCYRI